jgi:hypothetical protein
MHYLATKFPSHPGEPEDIFKEFFPDLIWCQFFVIQRVFLKELRVSIHVRAIKDSITID